MKKIDQIYAATPVRAQVFRQLEKAILDGDLAPGTSLTEVKLSQELGVSRTPIREALMQLELEGLVKTTHNKRAVVVGISGGDVNDIYLIRTRIEGLAARRAAEHISEEELSDLREIVELQEFYLGRGDTLQVGNLDQRFHEIVYEGSRSRPLKQMLSMFHNYIQKARATSVRRGRAQASTEEHRAILTALENHNGDEAERLMGVHVENARKSFFELME